MTTAAPSTATRSAKWIACFSILSLTLLMACWYSLLSPSDSLPNWLPTALLTLPLLPAIPGILRGHRYTYGWAPLLMMLYWSHGIMEGWSVPEDRPMALAELILSLSLFWACIFYLRWSKQQS